MALSAVRGLSEDGLPDDLLDRRETVANFLQARAAEVDHPFVHRLLLQLHGGGAGKDELADLVGYLHDLVKADAAPVAGVVTGAAAAPLVELERADLRLVEADVDQGLGRHVDRLAAVLANAPDEALGADQVDRRRDQEWLDAHVHQAVDRRGRVVRVKGGEDQVPRQRRLDRDLGGLEVADLPDQYDVRVLPQERAEGRGEVQPDLLLHLHLVDAVQVELDRVLGRDDVRLGGVDAVDRGIESVRLARARRAGDQHHPVRLEDRPLELDERLGLEPELRHVEHQVLLVQQAENDLLPEQGRKNRDAVVHLLVLPPQLHLDLDAAVLGEALLGDVELRHDLDAARDGVLELHRRVHDLVEHAGDPGAGPEGLLVGLGGDGRRVLLDRVGPDDVGQLDGG